MKIRHILTGLILFLAGLLAGRITLPDRVEVRYEKQPAQQGSYVHHQLVPVKAESSGLSVLPSVPLLYYTEGQDTVEIIREVEKEIQVDTLAVLADYLLKRTYKETLFDNEQGRFDLTAEVQYNRMTGLSYNYTPVTEVRTITKKRALEPFLSAGYSTNRTLAVGGGVFIDHWGIEYSYNLNNSNSKAFNSYHSFLLKYKF